MIKYFCECCGKEMDNKDSRQILIYMKDPRNCEELKNDQYSLYEDDFKLCFDCSDKVREVITRNLFNQSQEDEVVEEYIEVEEVVQTQQPTFKEFMSEVVECLGYILFNKR